MMRIRTNVWATSLLGDLDVAARSCAGGRPFLVHGSARTAALAPRADWQSQAENVDLAQLTGSERRALAKHYARSGQMEHASIAAFARFSLQLLSLGAPPDLVAACTQAMADETRHALSCFALGSRYADADLGPAPLPIDGCLGATSLEAIVELVIAEGCVGETVAALEAAEAAEHACEPFVRDTLRGISDDESRHAQLAFRFVAWVLAQRPELSALVARAFAEHTQSHEPDRPRDQAEFASPRLAQHGLLSPSQLREVRKSALRDAVAPCARALLEAPGRDAVASPEIAPDKRG